MNEVRVSFSFSDAGYNDEAIREEFEQFREMLEYKYGITLYDVKFR